MIQPDLFQSPPPDTRRAVMNGKPVIEVPAKSVINFASAFSHKLLCDGLTFSLGSACVYSCAFCYVPDLMRKSPHLKGVDKHEDVVIRRNGALAAMRNQLTGRGGVPKFLDDDDERVIYSSPLVDCAGNMDLVRETIEACKIILEMTNWHIRLLSKSSLLPKVADGIPDAHAHRMIYGVSTGTLDDGLAAGFEQGTAKVSKRLASLHELQDRGLRTYGMLCPSLPLPDHDYQEQADALLAAIRHERCEHVWGEVLNVRGESFTRTIAALEAAGRKAHAAALAAVQDRELWEAYARDTFLALYRGLEKVGRPSKLRFLQYVTKDSRMWWHDRRMMGAILL